MGLGSIPEFAYNSIRVLSQIRYNYFFNLSIKLSTSNISASFNVSIYIIPKKYVVFVDKSIYVIIYKILLFSTILIKAFMKDRPKLKRIVGLTGTPASNGLMGLFAEFKLLDTGERLGRFIVQSSVSQKHIVANIILSHPLLS